MMTGGVYEEEACMRRIASRQLLKSASEMGKSRNCKKKLRLKPGMRN
jgi:hypothetical protein